jgi:hypothetical protein
MAHKSYVILFEKRSKIKPTIKNYLNRWIVEGRENILRRMTDLGE